MRENFLFQSPLLQIPASHIHHGVQAHPEWKLKNAIQSSEAHFNTSFLHNGINCFPHGRPSFFASSTFTRLKKTPHHDDYEGGRYTGFFFLVLLETA